ncbi:hypothetical protein GGR56DRAFT_244607 [Xylariaceae sp. FL0804]|nr:hypothetical protein GGR56DRAFT_244607 [Xylariaceae sp. FL0804]
MWGFPHIPNVQFNFPGLPKFHLPCVKVFGISIGSCTADPVTDGPADGLGDPTSSSCAVSQTVSDCAVQCASTTTSNSCASFIITCSNTQTGCSVTGITSTVSSSTSACASCSSCLGPASGGLIFSASPNLDYRDNMDTWMARGLAGRLMVEGRGLEKRGPKSLINALGGCALVSGAAKSLTRPLWPAVTAIMLNPELAGNLKAKYSIISRYDVATKTGPCSNVPTTTRLDAKAFAAAAAPAAPGYTDMAGIVRNNNKDASLDHAYEKSWIKDFFNQLVGSSSSSSKLACNDLNAFFFPKDPNGACQYNLVQDAWNAIGSDKNLDFVAMSQFVNGDGKGRFFTSAINPLPQPFVGDPAYQIQNDGIWTWPSGTGKSAKDAINKMRQDFELVLLGALEMKSSLMLNLIDRTNNRVYDALLNLDQRVTTDTNLFPSFAAWTAAFGSGGIAGAYKDYMTKNIQPQITIPPAYLTKLWADTIKTGIVAAENLPDVKVNSKTGQAPGPHYAEWQSFSNFVTDVDTIYLYGASYNWEYTWSFGWNRNNKRDESLPPLTCTPSSSTLASSTAASSSAPAVSSSPTTTRVAAPDVTIPTASATPDCNEGYATYTLQATATAPANAASLKIFIPQADANGGDWGLNITGDNGVDISADVQTWTVAISDEDAPAVTSGDGGDGMDIKWTEPGDSPNGIYVELLFTDPSPPLGAQSFAMTATGGLSACMSCSGSGLVVSSNDNGEVCTLPPCSTDPVCSQTGPITPRAACLVVEDGVLFPLWYDVTIVTNNFITDGGDSLKSEEKGCGAMTKWKAETINQQGAPDGSWIAVNQYSFTLPLTVKSGCVERAITSAGGLSGVQCYNAQSDWIF